MAAMTESLRIPTSIGDDQWRCYGAARRRELVESDESNGGTVFQLNEKCSVVKYFQLSERVASQFRSLCDTNESTVEDSYVMGHRIMVFLLHALPKHPEYADVHVAHLRTKCCQEMAWIREKMDEIALRIDEEQLNLYITNDFDPIPDDSSTDSDSEEPCIDELDFFVPDHQWNQAFGPESRNTAAKSEPWEDFADWGFKDVPAAVDTDTSSLDATSSPDASVSDSKEGEPDSFYTAEADISKAVESVLPQEAHFEDPELQLYNNADPEVELSSDDESEEDVNDTEEQQLPFVLRHDPYPFPGIGTHFLRKIADERVMYETDSEAVDSWAEDGDSGFLSASSGGGGFSCDPARIAFREIMNSTRKGLPRHSKPLRLTYSIPPQHPLPTDSPDLEDEEDQRLYTKAMNFRDSDHWASFDFASVRRKESHN